MANISLLARINDGVDARVVNASDVVDDVMRNLRILLNSRSGCCETRPEFGMEDFNALKDRFPDAIPIISQMLANQVRSFEPRLERVVVKHIPDPQNPLSLSFAITASLTVGEETTRISLDTVMTDDGYVRVRE